MHRMVSTDNPNELSNGSKAVQPKGAGEVGQGVLIISAPTAKPLRLSGGEMLSSRDGSEASATVGARLDVGAEAAEEGKAGLPAAPGSTPPKQKKKLASRESPDTGGSDGSRSGGRGVKFGDLDDSSNSENQRQSSLDSSAPDQLRVSPNDGTSFGGTLRV